MTRLPRLVLSVITMLAPLTAGAIVAAGVQAGSKGTVAMNVATEPLRPARAAALEPSGPPKARATSAEDDDHGSDLGEGPVVLPGPSLAAWEPEPAAPPVALPELPPDVSLDDDEAPLLASAFHFDAHVFRRPGRDPYVTGVVRRGTVLPVKGVLGGPGCRGGRWYRLVGGGAVCTRKGFNVGVETPELDHLPALPDQPLPYRYGMVVRQGAPRFYSLPTNRLYAEARAAIADGRGLPDGVEKAMKGEYYLAIHRLEDNPDGVAYYRTVRGRYVRAEDVELVPPPSMVGVPLDEGAAGLPLAFVWRAPDDDEAPGAKGAPLYRIDGEEREPVGHADKHARFRVVEETEDGFVVGPDGLAVRRDHVRIVRAIDRPEDEDIPADARWIHVELAEQTLVAYEGDRPVYATLVASGKDGYDTPRGHFQVRLKYVSTTMNGDDPIDGFYEVEEVPWTMYYFEGYALHGAYWHDEFGGVRSHGCTNLAPADARWLYFWSAPEVPAGWHGRRYPKGGTHLLFTRNPRDAEEPASPS
ncbi:MAG TPA: L,D-transpeptidase [Polyangiaceae bacterium LLY-WYZ-14_1]|nr:L,D-transpeptidase [Polyangiaceae bacterium LLY-WYZ-14_1]